MLILTFYLSDLVLPVSCPFSIFILGYVLIFIYDNLCLDSLENARNNHLKFLQHFLFFLGVKKILVEFHFVSLKTTLNHILFLGLSSMKLVCVSFGFLKFTFLNYTFLCSDMSPRGHPLLLLMLRDLKIMIPVIPDVEKTLGSLTFLLCGPA